MSARAEISSPVCETGLGFSARAATRHVIGPLHWQHTLQHSKKLEFYNTFKTEYTPSYYLDLTRKITNRKTLSLVVTTKYRERIVFALLADLMKLQTKLTSFSTALNILFKEPRILQLSAVLCSQCQTVTSNRSNKGVNEPF